MSPSKRSLVRMAGLAAGLAAAAAAVHLAYAATRVYPREQLLASPDSGTWPGVYHVHTDASDGSGSLDDVVAAVRASGGTWVIVSDHNVHAGPRFRVVNGVLVVCSPEVSLPEGHVTAVGLGRALSREERRRPTALADIRAMGGSPVAAHPLGRKRPYRKLDDPRLGGLEILSADQEYRDALVDPARIAPALLSYLVNPMHAVVSLIRRPDATFARWDQLLLSRRMPGYCAVDAHGLPPYGVMTRLLQMYAVVGRPPTGLAEDDGRALVDALVSGRSYCAINSWGRGDGFSFVAATGPGAAGGPGEIRMGDDLTRSDGAVLRVDLRYGGLPDGARTRLFCAGREGPLQASVLPSGMRFEHRPMQPGACRVEVSLDQGGGREVPWIVSNPIYVR